MLIVFSKISWKCAESRCKRACTGDTGLLTLRTPCELYLTHAVFGQEVARVKYNSDQELESTSRELDTLRVRATFRLLSRRLEENSVSRGFAFHRLPDFSLGFSPFVIGTPHDRVSTPRCLLSSRIEKRRSIAVKRAAATPNSGTRPAAVQQISAITAGYPDPSQSCALTLSNLSLDS